MQYTGFPCPITADDNVLLFGRYPLIIFRFRQINEPLDKLKHNAILKTNISSDCLSLSASTFYFFYFPLFKLLYLRIRSALDDSEWKVLLLQFSNQTLANAKKLGTNMRFSVQKHRNLALMVIVLADPSRLVDQSNLLYDAGALFGSLRESLLFHTLSYSSQKFRHFVYAIGTAESVAASETIKKVEALKIWFLFPARYT